MPTSYPYYIVWTGALHLGDTPGVFMDAQYAGLLVQFPITVAFVPDGTDPVVFVITTTEVEIFDNKKHPVYWDWTPGTPFPTPVGYVDDQSLITGKPEKHLLSVPRSSAAVGKHWLTIQVNPETTAGLRDDFVLRRLEAHESIGAKIGW
jgi:hypothetical protein